MVFQDILNQIVESVNRYPDRNAFCIGEANTTYREFGEAVGSIRRQLQSVGSTGNQIGVVLNDDFLTYSALVALWLEGKAYVPINPELPDDRNRSILEQAEIHVVLNSGASMLDRLAAGTGLTEIDTKEPNDGLLDLSAVLIAERAVT